MDWSRTKTIFIVTFLFLNSFLIFQLIEQMNANQINIIAEATIQERLEEMNIEIDVDIPEEDIAGIYIVGSSVGYDNEIRDFLSDQQIRIVDETTVISTLDEPYELGPADYGIQLDRFLDEYIWRGEEYRFAGWDEELRQVVLYQTYDDVMIYTFDEVSLLLQLNEEGEITGYQQNYLTINEQGQEREVLSGLRAIETLLNEQLMMSNHVVSHLELGYYSLLQPFGGVQVFAPMWRITVDDDNYLVHAIDGSIQQVN
ncbi:two-component system regulatory protein YycI [Desertibacillus haloalkaliphilus]|uniref:two-component system regulatory protein YycI n=1 Tax=Desertibacillus haloalkaliphilus TaxID=1328930 RepID=UPI001C25AAF8|nr:two-component system regulatory protein YycI [Desertibacillus haloalkaliphilus]MBU8905786.1 two-component system regulatory protein YycI [Desertibacillus haloalkaliphilus]